MKDWDVDFSARFEDGRIREGNRRVQAENIAEALGMAERLMADIRAEFPVIKETVIWDVGIITSEEDRPEEVF